MVRCRIARCLIAPTLKAGADGLYEIRAACRIWDFRCIVFPTSECLEPFHVHGHAKKRVVALYFTGHHYDLLGCDNGSLPKSILAIRGSPEAVPMRGGGAHDNDVDSGFLGIWLQTATNREQFGTLWDANSSVALTLGRPDIELDIDEAPQAKKRAVNPALQEDGTYREPCSYCAHVHVCRTSAQLSYMRYAHHQRWHKDLPKTYGFGARQEGRPCFV